MVVVYRLSTLKRFIVSFFLFFLYIIIDSIFPTLIDSLYSVDRRLGFDIHLASGFIFSLVSKS